MKSAHFLNEHPPFLKGLSIPEVLLLTVISTIISTALSAAASLLIHSFTPLLLGSLAGLSIILWLPKQITDRIIKWRTGKPVGWLYQRFDYALYPKKYIVSSGCYHNKKDKSHD